MIPKEKEQKTKGKEPNEINELLNGINIDNSQEVLEFVSGNLCHKIRLELIDNATSRSYQRTTKLIKTAIETLYQNGNGFDILLDDETTCHIEAGEFTCNLQGIRIHNDRTVYFNQILQVSAISDDDNIFYEKDLDNEFSNGKDSLLRISRYRPQLFL